MKWAGSGPYQWAGPTRPKIHGLGSSPAQPSWLLCMSTVTSFSFACRDVHSARPAWRGKKRKQRKRGEVFTWTGGDAGDCWWRRRQVGEMRASYCAISGKEIRRKEKKKYDSSPLFSARPGEEDDGVVSKRHRFAGFFCDNIIF